MLASNPVPTLNQQKADSGIPRNSLKPHPALVRRTALSCRVACSRGSWFRRDLSSAAGRAGCGQAPGFGSFRRETEQWRELADRHRARPRRAICQRSVGAFESLNWRTRWGWRPWPRPDPLNGTAVEARRLRHQYAGPVGRFAGWIAKRQVDNPLGRLAIERLDPRGPGSCRASRPSNPSLQEAFLPAPNASLGLAGSSHDLVLVPAPSAVKRTISARHTYFCATLRSSMRSSSRRRSANETVMDFPARIAQTRTCRKSLGDPNRDSQMLNLNH